MMIPFEDEVKWTVRSDKSTQYLYIQVMVECEVWKNLKKKKTFMKHLNLYRLSCGLDINQEHTAHTQNQVHKNFIKLLN